MSDDIVVTPTSPGIWWWVFLAVFSPLVAVGLAHSVIGAVACPMAFLWLAVGVVAYLLLNRFVLKDKYHFINNFSHELNHAVVSLMMFKKVHSFHVEENSGVVYHTAGGRLSTVVISLAPYCLPFFTYVMLLERAAMLPEVRWVADIIAGITVGFYAMTFAKQIGPHQTDINRFTVRIFPYWYIFTFIAFNLSVLILSLMPDSNLFHAFADLFVGYWHDIVAVVKALFVR